VEFPGYYTIQLSALCRSCFLDLIARHIHDYRRMVKILCYQLFCIEFPVIREVLRIIIIVFTSGPAVGKLIQHQHSFPVAGIEHGTAERMVGTSDTVKTSLLQLSAPALLRPFQCNGPDNAIIMVNTRSAQLHFLFIDTQSLFCIQ